MKIKLAILENDKSYLERIALVFNSKYAEKIEVYSFSDLSSVMDVLENLKIDVLVANDLFDVDVSVLPKRCSFAYLVDSHDIEKVREQIAICKFQKADNIYKQILNLYSENTNTESGFNVDDGTCKVLSFVSASGGTGSSTVAAAAAARYAHSGYRVLYLNMENFGSADVFFSSEGQGNFGDIIYAIKSKKGNLSLKMESLVKQDACGVYFYSSTNLALDMAELTTDERLKLIEDIKSSGNYDFVILDMDFTLKKETMKIIDICNRVIFVSDGSDTSNSKLLRVIESMALIEEQAEKKNLIKCCLLYNRFSSATSHKIDLELINEIGGIKRFEGYDTKQLVLALASLDVLDSIVMGE